MRLAVLAMCLQLAAVTTGCALVFGEEFEFHCPQPAAPGLAIAVGARANSPTPTPPTEIRQMIVDTMMGCGKITAIRVDGRPGLAGELVFSTGAKTKSNFAIDQTSFLKNVDSILARSHAGAPEANVLQALSVASDAAGQGGSVVLIDSGVQTTAPLDFRKNNLVSRRPALIAKALKQQGLLPDLSERKVIMAGLGYTAAPQEPLDEKNQAFLVDLWREIVTASGAKDVVVAEEPNTSRSAVTSPPVSVVKFPVAEIYLGCDTLSVLPDNGGVGFVADEAEFRDPAAARKILGRFAGFLRENPSVEVLIKGYVAHHGNGDLSQRRADRVKQELSSQGVSNTITAKGMGWGPYPSVSAPPDPRYDQKNRQVTIEVNCART
ncbi:OmpA family protein [Micromonospora sp. NPDC050784]|uniref:OmpA family protein n=1 Tax=Micromonospora sp. NPDC050784 TaxID=3364281 RepID=UPI0037A40B5E